METEIIYKPENYNNKLLKYQSFIFLILRYNFKIFLLTKYWFKISFPYHIINFSHYQEYCFYIQSKYDDNFI